MSERITIRGHFCGQTQPHAAHDWQTPQVYGMTTLVTRYQCAGYAPFLTPTQAPDDAEGKG